MPRAYTQPRIYAWVIIDTEDLANPTQGVARTSDEAMTAVENVLIQGADDPDLDPDAECPCVESEEGEFGIYMWIIQEVRNV